MPPRNRKRPEGLRNQRILGVATEALARLEELDGREHDAGAEADKNVLARFGASIVFSAIELFKAHKGFRRYAEDPLVAQAFKSFPISWRHPLAAAAVLGLRGVMR